MVRGEGTPAATLTFREGRKGNKREEEKRGHQTGAGAMGAKGASVPWNLGGVAILGEKKPV